MRSGLAGIVVAALAFCAPGALAAENIGCMDAVYGADDQAVFDRFSSSFELGAFSSRGASEEVLAVLSARAGDCAETHAWSPDAIEQAVLYKLSGVLDDALVASSSFTPAQWARLKAAYAAADKAIINRLLSPIIDTALDGAEAPKPTEADEVYFGRLMLRTGIPATQANSEFVGAWMGAQAMQELFLARFTKF